VNAQTVSLTDTLPAHATFVSFTAPAGWTVNSPPVGGTGTATASLSTLTQGSAAQVFTLVVRVDPNATTGDSLTNTATIGSATADGDMANNTADAATTVVARQADLAVTNVASRPEVIVGGTITYTISANLVGGNSAANQVMLTDALPALTTFVSFAAPTGWTVTAPAVGGTGTVTTMFDSLAQGSAAQVFTLVVRLGSSILAGDSVTNTATIASSILDPDPTNNSADATTQVTPHLRPAVTGVGPGAAPLVNVYDQSTGTVRLSFLAYDAAFTGGVRVAMGDVNGDGTPDIITGAGPGGGPHVRVFDGVTGQQIAGPIGSFYAFDPSFVGGVFVAAGDVNGDGVADIIVGAGAGGGPHVKVFSGADGSVLGSFYAYAPTFHGGVAVAAGDVNGDGLPDIITGAGAGGGPHVEVFSGAGGPVIASFFAYGASFHGGVSVSAGDLNGDGYADIVTGAGPGGGPHVKVFDGAALALGGQAAIDAVANPLASYFAYNPTFLGGVAVAVVQRFTGPLDVVTGPGVGGGPHVKEFDGLTDVPLDGFYAYDPTFLGGVFVG
jgi:uncharacterized repeat protein (TIGR01451 family)